MTGRPEGRNHLRSTWKVNDFDTMQSLVERMSRRRTPCAIGRR